MDCLVDELLCCSAITAAVVNKTRSGRTLIQGQTCPTYFAITQRLFNVFASKSFLNSADTYFCRFSKNFMLFKKCN